jgi:MFS transporter, DHA2 family, multidrug resistance protein
MLEFFWWGSVFLLGPLRPRVAGGLGINMIVGAAPPEKAGSASAMSETSQELGLTLGFVIPGSLGAAVYRNQMAGAVPSGTPDACESLTGAVASAEGLTGPLGTELLDSTREAFTAGLNATAGIGTAVFVAPAVLTADALRHVPPTGETEQAEDALASAPKADHDPKEVSMQPSE